MNVIRELIMVALLISALISGVGFCLTWKVGLLRITHGDATASQDIIDATTDYAYGEITWAFVYCMWFVANLVGLIVVSVDEQILKMVGSVVVTRLIFYM